MVSILGKIGYAILMSLLTETVIKKLVILLLEKLAEKSDNTVDDEIVKVVKEALNKTGE